MRHRSANALELQNGDVPAIARDELRQESDRSPEQLEVSLERRPTRSDPERARSRLDSEPFLLIVRTRHIVTVATPGRALRRVARDTRRFQHLADFYNYLVDSYGRRLPGLGFKASPEG